MRTSRQSRGTSAPALEYDRHANFRSICQLSDLSAGARVLDEDGAERRHVDRHALLVHPVQCRHVCSKFRPKGQITGQIA